MCLTLRDCTVHRAVTDNWSQYTGYIAEAQIPARKIAAYPFTANAAGQTGRIGFTTNSGRVRDDMCLRHGSLRHRGERSWILHPGARRLLSRIRFTWDGNKMATVLFSCGLGLQSEHCT